MRVDHNFEVAGAEFRLGTDGSFAIELPEPWSSTEEADLDMGPAWDGNAQEHAETVLWFLLMGVDDEEQQLFTSDTLEWAVENIEELEELWAELKEELHAV